MRRSITSFKGGMCVCVFVYTSKVLIFKPLCFIISWWFCFSVIKYSSDLGTRAYTLTHTYTLKHERKSHSAIYWSQSLCSLSLSLFLFLGRCKDSLLHHVHLVSITGRHGSATLQRELVYVCEAVNVWGGERDSGSTWKWKTKKVSKSMSVWAHQALHITQICNYIMT